MNTTPAAPDSSSPDSSTTDPAAPSASAPVAPAAPKKRMPRGTDIALTIVFLVLQVALVFALILPALFLVMASAGCFEPCNIDVVSVGFHIALLGPGAVFVVNLILSIVFLVQKRTAWLLSLLGGVASFLVFLLGVAIVFGAIG